jgi:hypothetical protein
MTFDKELKTRQKELTIGERRVRTTFNPSANSAVDEIKQKTAELINMVDEISRRDGADGEVKRLCALAQTHYEDAAMWAVKAATA